MAFPVGAETVLVHIGPMCTNDGVIHINGTAKVVPSDSATHTPTKTHLSTGTVTVPIIEGIGTVTLVASNATGVTPPNRTYSFTFDLRDLLGAPVNVTARRVRLDKDEPEVWLELLGDT